MWLKELEELEKGSASTELLQIPGRKLFGKTEFEKLLKYYESTPEILREMLKGTKIYDGKDCFEVS